MEEKNENKRIIADRNSCFAENGEKKLMITGILQSDADNPEKEYDYLGVLYPEGHIGDDYEFLFYHEDITEVFFRGYENEERKQFIEQLENYYKM